MPNTFYLLTAFGQDRPGIVANVTQIVFRCGGNIQDASMTRLGGEFTMMLVVSVPNARAEKRFESELARAQRDSRLVLTAKPLSAAQAKATKPTHATHLISVYGTDHPGIVYKVAQTLAAKKINITDLNTKVLKRSGKPLYVMMLEVQIPQRVQAARLDQTLTRLGRSLRLEIVLHDIEPIAL